MGAIPVEEFEEHCINYHQSRDAGFEAEYEVLLCMGPKFMHDQWLGREVSHLKKSGIGGGGITVLFLLCFALHSKCSNHFFGMKWDGGMMNYGNKWLHTPSILLYTPRKKNRLTCKVKRGTARC